MAVTKIVTILVALATIGVVADAQDIAVLLKNRQIVDREIGCVLNRNPCDVIGKQIKGLLPEALKNGCRRCTPEQARNARKLIAFMKQTHPDDWNQILQLHGLPVPVANYQGFH